MENHNIYNPGMECMDPEQRLELQTRRLIQTVALEYENVPLYRERMDALHIRPEDVRTLNDLQYLPFTEKTDLRDAYPFGLLAVPKSEIVRIQGSSGTTGKPIIAGYTRNDIDVWEELMARTLSAAGCTREDVVQVCYGYGLFTGGLGAHQGASRIGAMVVPMSSGNTHRQLMMMRDLGVTLLCCTPSYAIHLGESLAEEGILLSDLKLKAGCFGAEPWSENMRTRLEGLLGIDACDIYGLTEICGPGVAYECLEKRGMHLNEDHIIAETVDPKSGKPAPYGTPGELVLTTITKTGMPMIRYRTRDICVLDSAKCSCGRTSIRMSRVTGRTDEMMVIRGVNVFPSQIESVLLSLNGVTPHYLLVADRVNSSDILEVRVELTEDMFRSSMNGAEELKEQIGNRIKAVVGLSAKICLMPPKSTPRSEGKARHVIDNRKL